MFKESNLDRDMKMKRTEFGRERFLLHFPTVGK